MAGDRVRLQLLIGVAAMAVVIALVAVAYPQRGYLVPDQGGAYVEAVAEQPKFINPILASPDSIDSDLAGLVFDGLTKLNDRGEPIPNLASSWEVGSDNKTYTFSLREDVRWHDGVQFGPDDVVFTVRAMQNPEFQGNPELAQLWRNVRIDKIDPRTVRFQLNDAYAPFLEFTSVGILPAHLLQDVPAKILPSDPFNARPVGTGRLQVKAVTRDELVLQVNEVYFGAKPYLSTLRFRFLGENAKSIAALQRQEVQGIRRLGLEELQTVRQNEKINVYATPDLSKLTLLLFNTRAAIVDDKAIRQAITYAIDRNRLIDVVFAGQGVRADGPIAPASWAYKQDLKRYDFDPNAARAILDAAGWLEAADGTRQRGDVPLKLVLLTNDKPQRIKTAEEISRQLAHVGIEVSVQAAGWTGFVQDFLVPHKFQAALTEQWSPNFDPDTYAFWHSSQIASGLNFASWTHRRADELLENARRSPDNKVRGPLYDEFQAIFTEELPGIPLFYPLFSFAADRSVQGVHLGPMIETVDRFARLEEWYVKTKRVTERP